MLSEDGTSSAMNIKRKDDIAEQEVILVGKEEMDTLKGSGIMFNVISNIMFGSKPMITNFVVNSERVIEEKKKMDGVEFLSTNDILCAN